MMPYYKWVATRLSGTIVISAAGMATFSSVPHIDEISLSAALAASLAIPWMAPKQQQKISDDFRNAVQQNESSPESVKPKKNLEQYRKQ
ncbi:MAG TPA: hypothetical protein VGZ00_13025 [Candidatus Baltobacteraceae bacterium]|jgi:hypothetical protein|nr:hypothetical protein [Candidatus Baltobacteraceae bacterium]